MTYFNPSPLGFFLICFLQEEFCYCTFTISAISLKHSEFVCWFCILSVSYTLVKSCLSQLISFIYPSEKNKQLKITHSGLLLHLHEKSLKHPIPALCANIFRFMSQRIFNLTSNILAKKPRQKNQQKFLYGERGKGLKKDLPVRESSQFSNLCVGWRCVWPFSFFHDERDNQAVQNVHYAADYAISTWRRTLVKCKVTVLPYNTQSRLSTSYNS